MLTVFRGTFGRIAAIAILGLIALTFVFFGIDFTLTGTTFAAKVNGENIPILDFDRELQYQQAQYQQLYRIELDDDLRRELRRNVVDRLIRTEAMRQRIESAGYRISDARLSRHIRTIEAFQVGGEFSVDVYRAALANQGYAPAGFEVVQRRQLALLELQSGIASSAFLTPAEFRRYIELYAERREIAYAMFRVDDFLDQVEIDAAAIAAHYDANAALYMSEETVDFEYIEVDQATIGAGVEISDEDIAQFYEDDRARFQTEEERRVRHILVNVEDEQYAQAETEAAGILARIQAGEDFGELATELSDDAGTRAQAGELGWIGRGLLVGPFEDTLYSMEIGEVAGPVETEFGYHLLMLEEVRAGQIQPLEAVREELREQLSNDTADDLFYERANDLADRTFDAYDELATVATDMALPLQTVSGFPRTGDPALFANSAAIVQAAFSGEVLGNSINSALIELADDHVVVLRVSQHNLPAQHPVEVVAERIREELTRAGAEQLAADAATAWLADSESGSEDQASTEALGGTWVEPQWVERADAEVPTEVLATAFAAPDPDVDSTIRELVPMASGDWAVLLFSGIESGQPESVPREERDQQQLQLADQTGAIEVSSYVGSIAEQAKIRIPDEVLNPQFQF